MWNKLTCGRLPQSQRIKGSPGACGGQGSNVNIPTPQLQFLQPLPPTPHPHSAPAVDCGPVLEAQALEPTSPSLEEAVAPPLKCGLALGQSPSLLAPSGKVLLILLPANPQPLLRASVACSGAWRLCTCSEDHCSAEIRFSKDPSLTIHRHTPPNLAQALVAKT